MAHEQKYRALTVVSRKFVYGYFAEIDGRSLIFNTDGKYDVDPETVGQFIRLHDKDGTEIYDGDRIDTPNDKWLVVGWNAKYASFCLNKKGWMFPHWFGEAVEPENCKVVGNIYKNPKMADISKLTEPKEDLEWGETIQ
jgi:hypothetical protein